MQGFLWPPLALLLLWLIWALRRLPWQDWQDNTLQHLVLGGCVLSGSLWMLQAHANGPQPLHLIGAALLVQMVGPALASLMLMLVLLATSSLHGVPPIQWPWLALSLVLLPVLLSWGWHRLLQKVAPPNLFVYLLGSGFAGGALSHAAAGLALHIGLVAWPAQGLPPSLPFWWLLSWGEAFETGFLLTLMVVYRPRWVRLFDDRRYLQPNT
ncbi:energy-coupling factor ABC transporter permease [Leeia sp.]|uniref:energy-coupling factor ABC transporter permease n=1 Tax=Leeia sp. TaxID=2884678 RepID=UPI0035AE6B67